MSDPIRAIHYEVDGSPQAEGSCIEDGQDWPCATIRALDAYRAGVLNEAADAAETVAIRLHREGEATASNGAYDVMTELRRMAAAGQAPASQPGCHDDSDQYVQGEDAQWLYYFCDNCGTSWRRPNPAPEPRQILDDDGRCHHCRRTPERCEATGCGGRNEPGEWHDGIKRYVLADPAPELGDERERLAAVVRWLNEKGAAIPPEVLEGIDDEWPKEEGR